MILVRGEGGERGERRTSDRCSPKNSILRSLFPNPNFSGKNRRKRIDGRSQPLFKYLPSFFPLFSPY